MKKFIVLFCCMWMMLGTVNAQSDAGYVLFDLSFDDENLSREERAVLPDKSEMWFKGDFLRMKLPMGMGIESEVLVTKKESYLLLDIMGNKMAMKSSASEANKRKSDLGALKLKSLSDETRIIAGLPCKRADMVNAKDGTTTTVWYTDQLAAAGSWYFQMEGLKGVPLEFSIDLNGMEVRMKAREVRTESPPDKLFELPEGYNVMTQQEMMQRMGGSR